MADFSSEDDNNTEEIPPKLLGVPVTRSNTPDKIRALLPNSGRGWLLQKPSEYSSFQVSANRTTKIFNKKSNKQQTGCTRADRDTVMVFVFAVVKTENNGSGGGVKTEPTLSSQPLKSSHRIDL